MSSGNLASVLHGIEDLRLEQRPLLEPDPHEVSVAIRSVGICGSDVHYYRHGRIGDFIVTAPLILGHESSGVIRAVGREVRSLTVGQRVTIEPGVPCSRCIQCRRGQYNLCPDVRFLATPPIDGALTQYVDASFAHPLPDTLSFDSGALIEPLSVGIWANRKAGTTVGSRVLITGAGPIGVLAAQVSRAAGAAYVAIVDVNPERLRQATSLGIDEAIDAKASPDLESLHADIAIECSGAETATATVISALRPGGRAVLVGMSASPQVKIPVAVMQARELTVTATFRYANTYPEAISLAASGQVKLEEMVGLRVPLEQAQQALTAGATHPEVLKAIVRVSED